MSGKNDTSSGARLSWQQKPNPFEPQKMAAEFEAALKKEIGWLGTFQAENQKIGFDLSADFLAAQQYLTEILNPKTPEAKSVSMRGYKELVVERGRQHERSKDIGTAAAMVLILAVAFKAMDMKAAAVFGAGGIGLVLGLFAVVVYLKTKPDALQEHMDGMKKKIDLIENVLLNEAQPTSNQPQDPLAGIPDVEEETAPPVSRLLKDKHTF